MGSSGCSQVPKALAISAASIVMPSGAVHGEPFSIHRVTLTVP
jgi:hypothetical protein